MSTDQQKIEEPCIECGESRHSKSPKDICRWCWMKKNHPETMRKEAIRLERIRLMQELGMPPDAAWKTYKYNGELFSDDWAGYKIEVFGMSVGGVSYPYPWPYISLFYGDGSTGGIVTQLWQQQARYCDSGVVGEIRYHPERGYSYAIKGNILEASDDELIFARRGIEILSHISHVPAPGRPLDRGLITEATKRQVLDKLIEIGKQIYQKERKVSQEAVAEKLDGEFGLTDDRAIRRFLTERCRKSWKKDILPKIRVP